MSRLYPEPSARIAVRLITGICMIQNNELPRSKLRGISLVEFIELIEASFEEFTRKD
jgi:hypothetical protein